MTFGDVAVRETSRRALTPVLVGSFLALAAAIRLVTAISLWHRGTFLDRIWQYRPREHLELLRVGGAAPALFFAFSIVIAVTSVDCFGRRRWGWWFAISIFAIDGLAAFIRAFIDSPIDGALGTVFSLALVWSLSRPRVRVLFDR